MSRILASPVLIALLFAGCDSGTAEPDGPQPDAATAPDASKTPDDLKDPSDLARPDLGQLPDLYRAPDDARGPDLEHRDLTIPDALVVFPDLVVVPDLADPPDLAMPDLAPPPDLVVVPDLVQLPDLTVLPDLVLLPDMACVGGIPCIVPNSCHDAVTVCQNGKPVCVEGGGWWPDGHSCGPNLACKAQACTCGFFGGPCCNAMTCNPNQGLICNDVGGGQTVCWMCGAKNTPCCGGGFCQIGTICGGGKCI